MGQEHLEDLRSAWTTLLNMRRDWARTLAPGYQRGHTEDAIKGIVDVQHAIEAIDREILDERDL